MSSGPKEVFTCCLCGECCCGRGGILLSSREIDFLADYLKMDRDAFLREYVESSPSGLALKVNPAGVCILNQEGRCGVHPVKPRICRDWPFLPAILLEPDELEGAKSACPGIAPGCSHEEFLAWWRKKVF